MNKAISRSEALATKLMYAALSILKENGKEMPIKELMDKVKNSIELDDWAKSVYEKTGYIRWESILHFYSIDCVKAGYLIKNKGVWYITPEGEKALKLGPEKLREQAKTAYKAWVADQPDSPGEEAITSDINNTTIQYEVIEQKAREGIEQYLNNLNPYEFQDIAAALLRGMGYFTPFVSPKGRDGGIDIIAYRDPLGTESPRIKVQIKHKEAAATGPEIQQLLGIMQKQGDIGIFISTGGFTADAKVAARNSHIHIELINLNRFIELWQQFYDNMSSEDKSFMLLRSIFILGNKTS